MNQRAASCALLGRPSISSNLSDPHWAISVTLSNRGQCNRMWRTVCACQPHWHARVDPGTCIAVSHALSPITSVRRRNRAVASALESPAYSMRRSCDQGARHAVAALIRGKACTVLSHCACQAASPQRFTSVTSSGSFGGRLGLRVVGGLYMFVHFSRSLWLLASACCLTISRWEGGRWAGDLG